jgi:hypothetical protein
VYRILSIRGAREFFLIQDGGQSTESTESYRILPIRDAREFFLIQDGGQRPGRGTAYHRNRSQPGKENDES